MKKSILTIFLLTSIYSSYGAMLFTAASSERQSCLNTNLDHTYLNLTNSITVSFWMNLSSLSSGVRQILAKANEPDTTTTLCDFRMVVTNIDFYYRDPNGPLGTTFQVWRSQNKQYLPNAWRHIALSFTYGTGSSLLFYSDGTNATVSGAWIQAVGNGLGISNNFPFHIGANNAAGQFFDGAISEVAIWSSTLTSRQINLLGASRVYGLPLQISPSTLVVYWPENCKNDGSLSSVVPNSQIDRGKLGIHLNNGGTTIASRVHSYAGNE